jgi:hypothetical protein
VVVVVLVDGERKIGSGANFVDTRRGSTDPQDEEKAGGGISGAPPFVRRGRFLCSPVARLCLFAQRERLGMG